MWVGIGTFQRENVINPDGMCMAELDLFAVVDNNLWLTTLSVVLRRPTNFGFSMLFTAIRGATRPARLRGQATKLLRGQKSLFVQNHLEISKFANFVRN